MYIGLLAAPGNFSASAKSCNTTSLQWTEPYSLDGVPILGYQVTLNGTHFETDNMNNKSGSDEIVSNGGTKTFIVTNNECQDPCIPVNAFVAGRNKVGIGKAASTMYYFLGG